MDKQLQDIDLCEALSDIFVDNEVDYENIASIVKHFSLEHVEKIFFEWVAPVCYTNRMAPIFLPYGLFLTKNNFGKISSNCKQNRRQKV